MLAGKQKFWAEPIIEAAIFFVFIAVDKDIFDVILSACLDSAQNILLRDDKDLPLCIILDIHDSDPKIHRYIQLAISHLKTILLADSLDLNTELPFTFDADNISAFGISDGWEGIPAAQGKLIASIKQANVAG